MRMKNHNGVTLIELMIVLAAMAIIATMAVPGMNGFVVSNKLRGAAGGFYSDVHYARSEAIKRKTNISVSVTSNGATWCYGIDENPGCDCTITDSSNANACTLTLSGQNVLKVGSSADFANVNIASPVGANQTFATFDPTRGLAFANSTVVFQSSTGHEARVLVSALGRVSACSPAGASSLSGFSAC